MNVFEITLPYKLEARGNKNEHPMVVHSFKKKQIADIKFLMFNEIKTLSKIIEAYRNYNNKTLLIKLIRIAPRYLDSDNLATSFKFIRDYIADIFNPGLAPGQADANENLIKFSYDQEKGAPKLNPIRMEFTLKDREK